uniref:(northern house mosquito) hypothetical protein n=1 Tax=Culex pipiens TaxID=7175 RepID=A0A8D8N116_CULPI
MSNLPANRQLSRNIGEWLFRNPRGADLFDASLLHPNAVLAERRTSAASMPGLFGVTRLCLRLLEAMSPKGCLSPGFSTRLTSSVGRDKSTSSGNPDNFAGAGCHCSSASPSNSSNSSRDNSRDSPELLVLLPQVSHGDDELGRHGAARRAGSLCRSGRERGTASAESRTRLFRVLCRICVARQLGVSSDDPAGDSAKVWR